MKIRDTVSHELAVIGRSQLQLDWLATEPYTLGSMAESPPLHSLAEERSLALHAAVADRLLVDKVVLEKARARLQDWRREPDRHPYVEVWEQILSGTPEEVARALVERTHEACTLRQASPFAGALHPRTRWAILRRPA